MIHRNIKVRMRTEIETKERWDVPFLVELDEVIDQDEHPVALEQVIEEEYKGGSNKSGDAYYYIIE